jgi:hypothetical protein
MVTGGRRDALTSQVGSIKRYNAANAAASTALTTMLNSLLYLRFCLQTNAVVFLAMVYLDLKIDGSDYAKNEAVAPLYSVARQHESITRWPHRLLTCEVTEGAGTLILLIPMY